jgi:hypothetical protein
MSATDERPLPEATRDISLQYGPVSYQRLWAAVLSGTVPATKRGRSWHIRRAHYPQIAATLGLTSQPIAA